MLVSPTEGTSHPFATAITFANWTMMVLLFLFWWCFSSPTNGFRPSISRSHGSLMASVLPKMEFTVEDFLPSDEDDVVALKPDDVFKSPPLHQQEMQNESSMEDDETEDLKRFVDMIEDTPRGDLSDSDVELMQEILSEESSIMEDDTILLLERMLFRLAEEWLEVHTESARPSEDTVLRLMREWQRRCIVDADRRNRASKSNRRTNTDILPTATEHMEELYNMHFSCFGEESSTRVAELLLEVICYRRGVSRQVQSILRDYRYPSPKMKEHLIVALSRDGKPKAAEAILRKDRNLSIEVETLNYILTGYAKASDDFGAAAEELVVYMTDERDLSPNASTFTCLIDCYSQENTWSAAMKCQNILDQMIQLDDPTITPNIVAWTSVMSTWGRLTKEGKPQACDKVNELMTRLQETFDPADIDAHVYIAWMRANAWSLTESGLKQAEEILNEMHELFLDGGDESFQPNALSIRTIVDAYLRSDLPNKAVEATRVAEEYETYLESNKEVLSSVLRMLLFAWTQAGNPVHAESYLERLIEEELEVDSFSFDKIIETNMQINDTTSMQRNVRLFELMEECRVAGKMKPNERVYTSFLRAMTKAKVPQLITKVQALLARMNELQTNGDNHGIRPTVFTYNAVLQACAASEDDEREAALALSLQTFQTLRSKNLLDNVSIGGMLRCGNLVEDQEKRDSWIKSTFRLACDLGLVNTPVLRTFKGVATVETWKLFFGDDDEPTENSIPNEWKKNSDKKRNKPTDKRNQHRRRLGFQRKR